MSSVTENNNSFFLQKKFTPGVSERELYIHQNNFSSLVSLEMLNNNNNNNNNNQISSDKNINDVWTKDNFVKKKIPTSSNETSGMNVNIIKTWASQEIEKQEDDIIDEDDCKMVTNKESSFRSPTPEKESSSPSHHARRPMNAFLIFCKKHRPIVRLKFPNLENRGITRILGEWWAMLDSSDKSAYTTLAKEYKDAFFSANPDFKWYKLPAPPLRTLTTRPTTNLPSKPSPVSSPTQVTSSCAEFTPGKLADESQLGSLTSLLSPTSTTKPETVTMDVDKSKLESNQSSTSPHQDQGSSSSVSSNNMGNVPILTTPETSIKVSTSVPPKKRISENFNHFNNKNVVRDIFNTKSSAEYREEIDDNVTKQDLVDKVVDSIFSNKDEMDSAKDSKEPRKSIRSCKGRRYAEFMVEGKLFGNKHNKKMSLISSFNNDPSKSPVLQPKSPTKQNVIAFDLEDTIKRLAERTNKKVYCKTDVREEKMDEDRPQRSQSENSDEGSSSSQSYFDLDHRISELPSLSYDAFLQRKRANKKRKPIRHKTEDNDLKTKGVAPVPKNDTNCLVGSKKRKNKNSITRLESTSDHAIISQFTNDLSGLATLAEIAANTEKIN